LTQTRQYNGDATHATTDHADSNDCDEERVMNDMDDTHRDAMLSGANQFDAINSSRHCESS